ncbi:MAG: hypothetical protein AAFX50_03060 [Acidobacteriota bacterium]
MTPSTPIVAPRTRSTARRAPWSAAATLTLAFCLAGGAAAPAEAQLVQQTLPFDVSTDPSTCVDSADVAVAPDGRFVVVWTTVAGTNLLWRRFDADAQPLEVPQSLNVGDTIIDPQVAIDAVGNFTITFQRLTGSQEPTVFRYDANGAFQGPTAAPGTPGASNDFPTVAAADDGTFVIAWSAEANGMESINARRYDAAGMPVGSDIAVSPPAATHFQPTVGVEPDGDGFVVAWTQVSNGLDIAARRFDASGAPVGAQLIANTYTTGSQSRPSLDVAADGSFVVSWQGQGAVDSDAVSIGFGRFAPDNSVIDQQEFGDPNRQESFSSTVTSYDGGSYSVFWSEDFQVNPGDPFVAEARVVANASVETTFPDAFRSRRAVSVDLDGRERAVYIWNDRVDNAACGVLKAARYQTFRELGGTPYTGAVHSLTAQQAMKPFVYFAQGPSTLRVTLTNATGDADLFTRFGDFASLSDFDCRSNLGGAATEVCQLDTTGRPLLIGVNGFATGQLDFTLSVQETPAIFLDGFESGDTSAWDSTVQ